MNGRMDGVQPSIMFYHEYNSRQLHPPSRLNPSLSIPTLSIFFPTPNCAPRFLPDYIAFNLSKTISITLPDAQNLRRHSHCPFFIASLGQFSYGNTHIFA